MISVLILTKNEEQDLPGCLTSVAWCDDIHVFDSYSEDRTVEIALTAGAKVTQRKFDNWAAHQNWALSNIPFKYSWVLYIDADERVSSSLYKALESFDPKRDVAVAYNVQRRDFAWDGTWLKHAQMSPFYLRLFRPEKMQYKRLVNPLSLPDGPTSSIEGYLDHYPFSKGIKFWLQRHLGYAEMEAIIHLENTRKRIPFSLQRAFLGHDFSERRYHQKGLFYKFPGRPIIKWFYLVFWRRAFLDGRAGLTYATLQAIYEYFIVLKSSELLREQKQKKNYQSEAPVHS